MTWWDAAFLAAAGVLGGLTGSIAGLASVATYPALLVVGLPPVTANVTNTVALVFNGIGSVWGSRPELKGQGRWLKRIAPGGRGRRRGRCRAAVVHAGRGLREDRADPARGRVGCDRASAPRPTGKRESPTTVGIPPTILFESVAIFLICIYGGYFGAAAGVLLLALLLRAGHATLAHANAAKNVIPGVANCVAALIFTFLAPVHWPAVVALGLGCLVGSGWVPWWCAMPLPGRCGS